MKPLYDPKNPIAAAVFPLRSVAADRAEQKAREIVKRVREKLAEAGNDLEKVAPYPKSFGMSRGEYMAAVAHYQLYHSICKSRASTRSMRDPDFADVDPERVKKFVADARKNAEEQYDAFIVKLIGKCGEVRAADLEGNHVWGHSHLTVTKADKSQEIWRTQMILNVSKLGKVFNQFPSRQVKSKRR